jgi:hypothetical protein
MQMTILADGMFSMPQTNSPADPTRRGFLSTAAGVAAGSTVLAMAAIPLASAAAAPDPIFAMIAMHRKLQAEWARVNNQLDEAEFGNAAEGRSRRPTQLIGWRGYTIGGSEIDLRRQALLEAGNIEPATVEEEYLDAKARYVARVAAGLAWDDRNGLATLRKDLDRGVGVEQRYAERLARTKPTTPAGVATLIQYVLDDYLEAGEGHWHMTSLKTAVAALNSMGAAVSS